MNNIIAENLRSQLTTALPFIDKSAGLTRLFYKSNGNPDSGKTFQQRFPIACKTPSDCSPGETMNMVPDGKNTCMIYFEDDGIVQDSGIYTSRLTLVCWYNADKFQTDSCTVNDKMIMAMADSIIKRPYNTSDEMLQKVQHQIKNIPQKSASVFQRYTYSEFKLAYLNPPYDYFTIQIETTFSINKNCLITPILKDDLTCL